jgi:hypothetical protein
MKPELAQWDAAITDEMMYLTNAPDGPRVTSKGVSNGLKSRRFLASQAQSLC